MTDTQTAPSTKTEYPISWTVRYQSSRGYDCMFTVRGETVAEVTRQAGAVLASIEAAAAQAQPAAAPGVAQPAAAPPAAQPDPSWCPIHGVHMERRERNGDTWYSHHTPDGGWCRGK